MQCSATSKSLCREFSYKQVTQQYKQFTMQLESSATNQKNHPVNSSAIQTCYNSIEKVITLQRDQLDNNQSVPVREIRLLKTSPYRVLAITKKPPCREFSSCKYITLQRVQLCTDHPVESSARKKSSCREISQKSPCREFSYYKQITLQIVQLQTTYPIERSARRSYLVESSATKNTIIVESSAANKSPCRKFSYKSLQRDQLEEITLQRVQLQRNHHVESSATNKSPCREFSQKQVTLQRDQLETSHPVERSATNKSPCREFNYKKKPLWRVQAETDLQRVQLETSHLMERSARNKSSSVERSATNKSPYREFSYKETTHVESSAANISPCRECSYEQITLYRVQLEKVILQRDQLEGSPCSKSSTTKKSLCREFSYKHSQLLQTRRSPLQRVQLQRNHM